MKTITTGLMFLLYIVSTISGLGSPVIVDVEKLTEEDKKVVDFALVQLQGGEGCSQRLVKIENFSRQVVSGFRYKFDIVVDNTCDGSKGEKKCSMDVYSVPWEQRLSVNWDQVICDMGDDSSPHMTLLGGDDHDKVDHNKMLVGYQTHGPKFSDEYQVNQLKSEDQSRKELKKLQSLESFHQFMTEYNKTYSSKKQYKHRYGIFKQNMKKVQFLRESEQGTADYGLTMFSDLTEMEYKQYLGTPVWQRRRMSDSVSDDIHWPPADIPNVQLPKQFDWREHGAVTEVKNQGQCGSCWAFSVTGNVEGAYAVKHGKLLDLSEQELVDCDTRDNGCNGGLPENAYKTLIEIGGLETEQDYGYDGEDEACKFNRSRVAARVKSGVEIGRNETQMAQWLLKNGPISVGLNANAMQFYKGGVSHPFSFLCDPSGVDHGVLIVGFGEHEYPLFKKKMPFWIIKNSWGTGWGEQGYYRLYRGDGSCGINMLTSSAIVE